MDTQQTPLSPELLHYMNAYWREANYLAIGQISLYDNPLLKEALQLEHVKPRLLGHWGTTPGQNLSMCTSIVCTIVADMQEWDDDDEGQRTANIHRERPAWALSCDGGPGGGRARRGSRSAHGNAQSLCGPGAGRAARARRGGPPCLHGGADHTAHERVDADLGDDLRRLAAYTPLHVLAAI